MSSVVNYAQPEQFPRITQLGDNLPLSLDVRFQLHSRQNEDKETVKSYIANKYLAIYGAKVSYFLPHLVELQCNGKRSAACGLRDANAGKLYLENYLDRPIEQAVATIAQRPIHRSAILEIGNLVSTWKGSSQILFLFLTLLADHLGYQWVAFTGTEEVHRLLKKMSFQISIIGKASAESLGAEASAWGSYYEKAPQVMVGYVPPAAAIIQRHRLMRQLSSVIKTDLATVIEQWRGENAWNA